MPFIGLQSLFCIVVAMLCHIDNASIQSCAIVFWWILLEGHTMMLDPPQPLSSAPSHCPRSRLLSSFFTEAEAIEDNCLFFITIA